MRDFDSIDRAHDRYRTMSDDEWEQHIDELSHAGADDEDYYDEDLDPKSRKYQLENE